MRCITVIENEGLVSSLGNVVRPVLVRSPKLSSIGLDQYLDGRPPGNLVGVLYDIWGFFKPLGLGAMVGRVIQFRVRARLKPFDLFLKVQSTLITFWFNQVYYNY